MQNVVSDEPYEFVPPFRSPIWPWGVEKVLPWLLRSRYGIVSWETSGLDHLRASLKAGHGIILCPTHSRTSDPMMTGSITRETPCDAYAMASWHVFKQSWLETLVCRGVGAFSVYREGLDRKALDLATSIVANAERPLIIFPEGVISAANDRLMPLMDGVSFVARAASKRRVKKDPDARVMIHPVFYQYTHQSDPEVTMQPVLHRLEKSLFWQTNQHLSVEARIGIIDEAVQSLREVQFLGHARTGSVPERSQRLANEILQTHELEWLGRKRTGDIVSRVKELRIAIIPDMAANQVDDAERKRRWRQLTCLYFAQTMSLNVPGYLDRDRAGDRYNHRLFETLERLEEDLTDKVTVHRDMHVKVRVGAALEVDPTERRSRENDPLTARLRKQILQLMGVEDQWPRQPVEDCTETAG